MQRLEEAVHSLGSENIPAPEGKACDELMGLSSADQQPWQPGVSRRETWPLVPSAFCKLLGSKHRSLFEYWGQMDMPGGVNEQNWCFPIRGLRVTLECGD